MRYEPNEPFMPGQFAPRSVDSAALESAQSEQGQRDSTWKDVAWENGVPVYDGDGDWQQLNEEALTDLHTRISYVMHKRGYSIPTEAPLEAPAVQQDGALVERLTQAANSAESLAWSENTASFDKLIAVAREAAAALSTRGAPLSVQGNGPTPTNTVCVCSIHNVEYIDGCPRCALIGAEQIALRAPQEARKLESWEAIRDVLEVEREEEEAKAAARAVAPTEDRGETVPKKEFDNLWRMLVAVVVTVGGEVRIPPKVQSELPGFPVVERWDDPATGDLVIRVLADVDPSAVLADGGAK